MKLMLDTVEYKSKPNDTGTITNRIVKYPVDITIEQLAQEVIKGKSFVPAYLNTKDKNNKIRRSKECWTSQEIICLDFDNGMTIEEAIEEFKNDACFIYTTFSHTKHKHKFRVVFKLNEIIHNKNIIESILKYYVHKYKNKGIDEQCTDCSRLFYGGKNLVILNYNNELIVDDLLLDVDEWESKMNMGMCVPPIKSNKYISSIGGTLMSFKNKNNIELIRRKDIESLQKILKPDKVIFNNHEEVYDYLKKQDLYKFLGLSDNNFCCIFHNDNNPSSGIIVNNETGHYIYSCLSESCTFGKGTIIKCVQRIIGCNRIQALRFLRKVYNIEYYETEWQKEMREMLNDNISYLVSDEFKDENPELYSIIYRYIGDLNLLHNLAIKYMPSEKYNKEQVEALFFASLRHLSKITGNSDHKQWGRKIALFVYLGLMFKLKENEIPEILLKQAKRELMNNKSNNNIDSMKLISFFTIPSYSDENMLFSKEKAKIYKEKGLTMRGMSREMILRACGEDEANRVFPQFKDMKLSERSHDNVKEIEDVALSLIEQKGYVTEKEIVEYIGKSKFYTTTQIKKMIGEFIDKYCLHRKKLNKTLKDKFNYEGKGYPYIIYKNN